jgi:hypothetical protein
MIESYINKLIENLPVEIKQNQTNKTPMKVDLILDGGLFNGSYLVGALYFIKEMEARKYIKVERISGCSIGSIVGFLYFIDALDELPSLYESLLDDFKHQNNFSLIKNLKQKLVHRIPNDICVKVFKRLYIAFNNVKNGKKIVKKTYRDVDEIFDSIIKSCYIPFVIDGNLIYQNKYMDGLNPYIFNCKNNKNKYNKPSTRKIIFMDLLGFDKISYVINVKNEKTNFHRILSGMLDIHNFFIKGGSQTQMCSYVGDWTLYNYFLMSIRYLIEKIIIYKVYFLNLISMNLSQEFKQNLLCKLIGKMCKEILSLVIHSNF